MSNQNVDSVRNMKVTGQTTVAEEWAEVDIAEEAVDVVVVEVVVEALTMEVTDPKTTATNKIKITTMGKILARKMSSCKLMKINKGLDI